MSEVLDDEAVEMVVEVMGGTDLAKTVVTRALRSGKHVVTANKALIAANLPELNKLVEEVNAGRALKVTLALGHDPKYNRHPNPHPNPNH